MDEGLIFCSFFLLSKDAFLLIPESRDSYYLLKQGSLPHPIHGLLGTQLIAGSKCWVSEQSFACIATGALPPVSHPTTPCSWKKCLPRNWSPVPKMLGTAILKEGGGVRNGGKPLHEDCCLWMVAYTVVRGSHCWTSEAGSLHVSRECWR